MPGLRKAPHHVQPHGKKKTNLKELCQDGTNVMCLCFGFTWTRGVFNTLLCTLKHTFVWRRLEGFLIYICKEYNLLKIKIAGKRCDYNMYFQQYDSYSYGL